MALHINLYHEIQRARKEEQYDPLKISLMCIGFVGLCLAGLYFGKLTQTMGVRDQYAAQKAEISKLEPQSAAAKLKETELTASIQLADKLNKRIEDRFYWAPVMEQIGFTIPGNVQITKLTGDISTTDATRRIGIALDGIAAGEQPRKVAEDIRLALLDTLGQKYKNVTAVFRSLDDSAEQIRFEGKAMPTALFSINITFSAAAVSPAAIAPRTVQR